MLLITLRCIDNLRHVAPLGVMELVVTRHCRSSLILKSILLFSFALFPFEKGPHPASSVFHVNTTFIDKTKPTLFPTMSTILNNLNFVPFAHNLP
jgi:hypothetical protein